MNKNINSKKIVGYMMYAVAVIMPFSNIPQINQIYSTKVVTGLSLFTWVSYMLFGLIPLSYAVLNKLKPLIISNVLWVIIDLAMIYGIIIYSPNLLPKDFERLLIINNIGKTIGGIGLVLISTACALYAADLIGVKHEKK
jgi:hypothetical protein